MKSAKAQYNIMKIMSKKFMNAIFIFEERSSTTTTTSSREKIFYYSSSYSSNIYIYIRRTNTTEFACVYQSCK